MNVIICGGRDHPQFTLEDIYWLNSLGITKVITGGARGVDRWAANWAEAKRLPLKVYEADWETFGRAAGPIRNGLMLVELVKADAEVEVAVIAFPGGKGTADMVRRAKGAGVQVIERRLRNAD